MNVISDFGFKVGAAFGAGMAKGMSSSGNVVGQANNKNNTTRAEVIEEDMKIASEMAANINVGSDSIMESVYSMEVGAKFLDDVWKGDTKETFMEELKKLGDLIKQNSEDMQNLGNKIEIHNKITEEQKNEDYKEADVLYNKSN